MKKHAVLGLVGMPGSGKSVAIKAMSGKGKVTVVNMGDMVRGELAKQGIPVTPEALGNMAEQLREARGPDVVALLTMEQVDEIIDSSDLVIIDGIRSLSEVETFRKKWPLPVLAVHSPPRVRHTRLMQRGRSDDAPTVDHVCSRDARELGFGIGSVIAMADAVIVNDTSTSLDQLEAAAAAAIDSLLHDMEVA